MGIFIDSENNYPRHSGDIQLEFPDFEEGVSDLPDGWREVVEGIIPEFDPEIEVYFEIEPALVDGVLTQQFAVRNLTEQEIANRLLYKVVEQ